MTTPLFVLRITALPDLNAKMEIDGSTAGVPARQIAQVLLKLVYSLIDAPDMTIGKLAKAQRPRRARKVTPSAVL